MVKGILVLLVVLLLISVIIRYKLFFISLAVLGIAAYITIKYFKKMKSSTNSDSATAAERSKPSLPQSKTVPVSVNEPQTLCQAEFTSLDEPQREHSIFEQFESELQAIPRVDIPLSDPVPRHLLKDLPPYTFSNITRTTRLDSIFPLVFLDTETTGLYPSKSEIVEVSAIKFDQGMVPVSCFTTFCKPRKPIPEEATAINHITDDMVAGAPEFRQIAQALTEFLQGCNIAGHNLDFDLRFVFAHGADLPTGKRFYDTLDLAHLTISKGDIRNYKLDTLCSYYGISRKQAHRSLSDCYATSKVFTNLVFDKTSRQLEAALDAVSNLDTTQKPYRV